MVYLHTHTQAGTGTSFHKPPTSPSSTDIQSLSMHPSSEHFQEIINFVSIKHCMNLWNTVTIWSVQISLLTNMQFFLNLPTSCSFPPSKSASSFLLSAIEKEQLLCHLWKAEQGLPFLWEKELPIIGNTFTSATSLNKWRKQFSQKV